MKRPFPVCAVFSVLVLSLFLIGSAASVALAGTSPSEYGILTWEYSEFTKAFRAHLQNNNLAHLVPLLIALIIGVLGYQYYQHRLFRQEKLKELEEARSTVASLPTQRRTWHRVQSSLDCTFKVIHDNESEQTLHSGRIVDLSGGGCRIASTQNLQIGDALFLNLQLNPRQKLAIKGVVTRTEFENDEDSKICLAGIQFQEINEKSRDSIIKWMFKHHQAVAEGNRRIEDGLCLRCGKPLSNASRDNLFCPKCQSIRETNINRF
ncbi:MAG: PilZ domain-containing protein [Syntrophomonadaceae bacterium]|nr:PilZ domain-containing protein [Syntrophomonadaceae bacterium]